MGVKVSAERVSPIPLDLNRLKFSHSNRVRDPLAAPPFINGRNFSLNEWLFMVSFGPTGQVPGL